MMNRAIWLAIAKAGFSSVTHGQRTIFIALRSCEISTWAELQTTKTIQNAEK
jgi:hypothetical protein